MLGAADIRRELGVRFETLAWLLMAAPLALSLLIETPLMLLSDRWPKRRAIPLSLAAVAVVCAIAALSRSIWVLPIAFGLWASAGGVAVGLAQGALMNAFPKDRERVMARWALLASIGDAAAPLLTLAMAALGGTWRATLGAFAAVTAAHALIVGSSPLPEERQVDDAEPTPERRWPAFVRGIGNRDLVRWLIAESLCTLLDEILVAFGTMHLREDLGASPSAQGAAFVLFAVGSSLGLLVTERLLARVSALRVLIAVCSGCIFVYVAWIGAPSVSLSVALAFGVGAFAAPLYPIAAAQTHHACPGEPGLVAAVGRLFVVFDVIAPVAVGAVADHLGIRTALCLLAAQPVGILIIALSAARRRGVSRDVDRAAR